MPNPTASPSTKAPAAINRTRRSPEHAHSMGLEAGRASPEDGSLQPAPLLRAFGSEPKSADVQQSTKCCSSVVDIPNDERPEENRHGNSKHQHWFNDVSTHLHPRTPRMASVHDEVAIT